MRFILFITSTILFAFGCNSKSNTTHKTKIAAIDTSSRPSDSLAFYFPGLSSTPYLDSFIQNSYSAILYNLNEPILFKNYIGHDVYRFLWSRSFHRPVVISLHNYYNMVWLRVKMLDREPHFLDRRIGGVSNKDMPGYIKQGFIIDPEDSTVLFLKADRKASIIYDTIIPLKLKHWKKFEFLIFSTGFYALPDSFESQGADGSRWVIEAHLKNNYHFIDRWGPEQGTEQLGLYLIKLSGLKEEIY
jgi:hypothetical protein